MAFDTLVVVGLQATCDDAAEPVVTADNREVLEFSWSVFDVKSGAVTSERQLFVKPDRKEGVTTFCTSMTGITVEKVESGMTFAEALQQFNNFVDTTLKSTPFCIVADGSWELMVCLRKEAKRKNVPLGTHLDTFIDLRSDFVVAFPDAASSCKSVKAMLKYLTLTTDTPSPRFALDKCRDMCRILPALTQAGHQFQPKTVEPSYDASKQTSIADEPHTTPETTSDTTPKPTSSSATTATTTADGAATCVVRLRGLPWEATISEVKQFFTGVEVQDVLFVLAYNGRPTGEALVRLQSEASKALAFDKQNLGRRYIEVYPSSQAEFDRTSDTNNLRASQPVQTSQPPAQYSQPVQPTTTSGAEPVGYDYVVRLRGLPYSTSEDQVVDFFQIPGLTRECVHVVLAGHDCRPTGEAFIELPDEASLTRALGKHKEHLGSRYIEVFKASGSELRAAMSQRLYGAAGAMYTSAHAVARAVAQNPYNVSSGAAPIAPLESVLRLRGLPYSASENEIRGFFTVVNAIPCGVHILFNDRNRPSGEAFVEFATEAELLAGLSRHRSNLGTRYIEVFRVNRAEMLMTLGYPFDSSAMAVPVQMGMGMNMGMDMYAMGYPYVAAYRAPVQGAPVHQHQHQHQQQQQHQQYQHPGSASPAPAAAAGNAPNRSSENRSTRGGVVVKMRGLPYTVSVYDIIDFCSGYDVIRDSISLGTTRDNRPSGEAWLEFPSYESAQAFVRDKNRTHLGNRYVELFLAP